MIAPRHSWFPARVRSLGPDCGAFWKAAGGHLFEWQQHVIDSILGVDEDGRFVSLEDGLDVARQNGKGVILQAVEAFFAFELAYTTVMHTAHEFATSQEHQLRLEAFIQDCPHLHSKVRDRGGYVHANGQESIRLKSGGRIVFKARTKAGGRGYSGDLLVWDEAMVIPDAVVGAQRPMLRASKAPFGQKTIYAGSAVDQELHEYGITFSRLRKRGLENAPTVSWLEWSAPFEHPNQMTDEVLRDKSWWHQANPSMAEGLIQESYMEQEIESMPARICAVELACVGDWPDPDGREETPIRIEDWDTCLNPDSKLQPPYCLAFDVSPERRTSIALAGRNEDDCFHVEIQECKSGTGWAPERIREMTESGDIEIVVCDGIGPAGSLILPLRELGVNVETINSTEHGQACGRLVDMVNDGNLAHLGSSELRDAIRGSKSRPLGDAWAWSRRNSMVDISPLVAATLALGVAAGIGVGEIAIY